MADRDSLDRGGIPDGAIVVGTWRRRRRHGPLIDYDTVRLIRYGSRWFVRLRSGPDVDVDEFPNRSLAHRAVAALVGEFWVYYPPAQRRPVRHAARRDTVPG